MTSEKNNIKEVEEISKNELKTNGEKKSPKKRRKSRKFDMEPKLFDLTQKKVQSLLSVFKDVRKNCFLTPSGKLFINIDRSRIKKRDLKAMVTLRKIRERTKEKSFIARPSWLSRDFSVNIQIYKEEERMIHLNSVVFSLDTIDRRSKNFFENTDATFFGLVSFFLKEECTRDYLHGIDVAFINQTMEKVNVRIIEVERFTELLISFMALIEKKKLNIINK